MKKVDLAEEYVRKYIEIGIKNRTSYSKRFIATVMHAEHPDMFKDVEDARSVIRVVTGANSRIKRKGSEQLAAEFAMLEQPTIECDIKPYDVPKQYKKALIINDIHGHENYGSKSIHIAYKQLFNTMTNVMSGHYHITQSDFKRSLTGEIYGSWVVGCLCSLYPRYHPQGNNWNSGFAIVEKENNGNFEVNNKMIIDGKIY
jgi:hypothetical protein